MKRFQRKIDKIFWFIVAVFPLAVSFAMSWNNGSFDYSTLLTMLPNSGFIYDIYNDIFVNYFNVSNTLLPCLITYFTMVELAHVLFDVVAFLPRWCHNFVGGFINYEE